MRSRCLCVPPFENHERWGSQFYEELKEEHKAMGQTHVSDLVVRIRKAGPLRLRSGQVLRFAQDDNLAVTPTSRKGRRVWRGIVR
jgi:hypothetical protein